MCESTDKVPVSMRQGHSSDTKQIIPALFGTDGLSLLSLQEPATCPFWYHHLWFHYPNNIWWGGQII